MENRLNAKLMLHRVPRQRLNPKEDLRLGKCPYLQAVGFVDTQSVPFYFERKHKIEYYRKNKSSKIYISHVFYVS